MIGKLNKSNLLEGAEENMPTCRHCKFTGSRMNFIHGNGPRKDVCARCGVELELISPDEATNLFSKEIANARLNLISRRWAPLFWILILWNAWFFFFRSINIWNWVILGLLIILTLVFPIFNLMSNATYSAKLSEVTPDFERPDGH